MPTKILSMQPVLMVRDINKSLIFYEKLGFKVEFTDSENDPKYAGITRDGMQLQLQWHDSKEWEYPNDRPTYRFRVDDVDGLYEEFQKAEIGDSTSVADTPWGTREFHIQDPDVNGLQFYRNL